MTANRAMTRAFSLIEILVVIMVIGILAAVVIPNTVMAGDTARVTAAAQDLRGLEQALEAYRNKAGRWPRDVNSATLPPEIADAFSKGDPFSGTTPVGGVYDYDGPTSSRGPRISIRASSGNPLSEQSVLKDLDEEIDDGVSNTGRLRYSGNTVEYYIEAGG